MSAFATAGSLTAGLRAAGLTEGQAAVIAARAADRDGQPRPAVIRDHWTAALRLYAIGRTSEELRAQAADPEMTRGLALLSGITEEQERAQVLAIAAAIDQLTAAGLTPDRAYCLAGLGPYPGAPGAA